MTSNSLDIQVAEDALKFTWGPLWSHFSEVGIGQQAEVNDTSGKQNRYYKWLYCLVKRLKPSQVVELGAAAGISTIAMALALPPDSKIISVDINPEAWRWMKADYNITKVLGDDLDLSIYPKDVDLAKTDLWFIDSLHEGDHLRKELELYKPFFKPGAVVVLDDIRINDGMLQVWNELPYDKCENTNPNHYPGFGFFTI